MLTLVNQNVANGDFEFTALREANNYRLALFRKFSPFLKGEVIEIGSGVGQFTEFLAKDPKIKNLRGVEPDERFCREFAERLPDVPLIQGTIKAVVGNLDAIVSINVLEHIEDDKSELSFYHKLLKNRQGRLCLFVPARPELYSLIDKDFGHFRRYVKKELKTKLERAGFEVELIHYYNLTGYFAWWLNFKVLRRRSFNVHSVRFYDRFIFPVSHFLENICPPPFGQNLIVIAKAK